MSLKIELFGQKHVALAWQFRVNPDSCGNSSHYENYIKFNALSDCQSGSGVTHVLIDDTDGSVKLIGFVTLRMSAYIYEQDGIRRGDAALEIVELAIDQAYEHKHYGSVLMNYVISIADDLRSKLVGIKYIVLCADEQAVGFYQLFDFYKLSDYAEIPRNGSNDACIPMLLRCPST